MGRVLSSGLAEAMEAMYVGSSPDYVLPPMHGVEGRCSKVGIQRYSQVGSEIRTLQWLWDVSQALPPDTPILYFHCKGGKWLGGDPWEPVRDWTRMMAYFCIDRWRDALKVFDMHLEREVKAVGCNRHRFPESHEASPSAPHFSGNFWWITAGEARKLHRLREEEDRMGAEAWIGGVGWDHMGSLHQSPMLEGDGGPRAGSHYVCRYPERMYAV